MGTNEPTIEEIEPFESETVAADVNTAAAQEWRASTTGFERVESILRRTRDHQSAKNIADRALVSEPTARKHLQTLVTSGHASAEKQGNRTLYRRNPDQHRFERIQQLANDHTMSELESSIREMKHRIRTFEDEYGATSPEELAPELAPDDEQGWDDVTHWKTTRRSLAFAKTALSFKETRSVDAKTTVGETNA